MHTNNSVHINKRTLIVGLGKTGLSCARFLAAQDVPLAITDSRENPPALDEMKELLPDVALFVGGFDEAAFNAAEQVLVSPGVSVKEPMIAHARQRGVPVLGDIELFARHVQSPVIAITGTNGKSTVTMLIADMARRAGNEVCVGGNLGTPALDLLMEADASEHKPDLYVLELSSFQLETTSSLNAVAAVVLNVSTDHMDRYTNTKEYAAAKARVYQNNGVMIINADDPVVNRMAITDRTIIRFGLNPPDAGDFGLQIIDGEAWLSRGDEPWLPESGLKLAGRHNTANALAALALGTAVNLPKVAMLESLRNFTGLPHRCQWVTEHEGVNWYNDSKATNVGAAIASITGMSGQLVLIAGGDAKHADFSALKDAVANRVRNAVLIGRDAGMLEKALDGVVPVVYATDMVDAVTKARQLATKGDSVLLAPACASFDMYSGFEQRGEVFMQAVREVAA